VDLRRVTRVTRREIGIRFAFGFAISVLAGAAVLGFGARFGGLLLAFPAILPATLTLLERRDGTAQATSDVRGAAIGGVALVAFAGVVALTVRTAPALSLLAGLGAWLAAGAVLFLGLRALIRLLGERQYLPEIPVDEAAAVVAALISRDLTVATAESCTGGAVAALLTSVPESGRVLRGGLVAYDGELKTDLLGVPASLIERAGSVSEEVSVAMAHGARTSLGADIGIGITGLTGGPAEGKPAGLTFIAVEAPDGRAMVQRFSRNNGPGRNDERAIRMALQMARRVAEAGAPPEDADHSDTHHPGREKARLSSILQRWTPAPGEKGRERRRDT
jgi:nicotinamide-nucleotide amidase